MRGPGAVFPAWLRAIGAAALAPAVAVALALLGAPLPARALGPHEVALLVNEAAPGSAELAAAWARLRGVPAANVVRVSVPPGPDGAPPVAITKEDFVSRVWEPARAQLAAAGVAPHVLAWVYSSGFPARVADSPATLGRAGTNDLSIAGATFLRARWPERPDATVAGVDGSAPLYVSPLFAGPAGTGGAVRPSEALDQSRNALLDAMPLPAAMLAWTGPRGQTPEDALAALERAAAADATLPAGAFFVRLRPGDPRSDAREWEFEEAAAALRSRGAAVEVSTNAPAEALGPLAGYLDGARAVDPLPALAPGAFADHFTSFAAAFDQPAQMKATAWLGAGAAFTAGTVAEPYARWEKFPAAAIFARRLDGLCALEALYASVRCPLQLLPLGDPLSAPWAPRLAPRIDGLPAGGAASAALVLRAVPPEGAPAAGVRYDWLVDGRPAGRGATFVWNVASSSPGIHEVRLVARVPQPSGVRLQGFARAEVEVAGDLLP